MEIHLIIAMLVSKYTVSFAPADDGSRVWGDMKNHFTALPAQLDLVFELVEKDNTETSTKLCL